MFALRNFKFGDSYLKNWTLISNRRTVLLAVMFILTENLAHPKARNSFRFSSLEHLM